MGYDPNIALVNTSKTGWAKPVTSSPMVEAEPAPKDPATLPNSSVWGRKPPAAEAPTAARRAEVARDADFPPPSSAPPAPAAPKPAPAPSLPEARGKAGKSTTTTKTSTLYDWSTEEANAEMDFDQPLFVGHRVGAGPAPSAGTAAESPSRPVAATSSPSHARGHGRGEGDRLRNHDHPESYRAMDRTDKLSRALAPTPAIPLLRERERTRPERQHIPASGPRVVQANPVPLRPGMAWATPAQATPVAPTLPGQWPEPQALSTIQQMEQQAKEKAAAELEQKRRPTDDAGKQEETRRLREQLNTQKESMTQLALQAAEKRRQEDEAEEQARKKRLQDKLAFLERQAAEQRERERAEKAAANPPPPPPLVQAPAPAPVPRPTPADPPVAAATEEPRPAKEKENPWTQRMQTPQPSLLLQKAAEEARGKGKGKGGKAKGKGETPSEDRPARGAKGAPSWKPAVKAEAAESSAAAVDPALAVEVEGKGEGEAPAATEAPQEPPAWKGPEAWGGRGKGEDRPPVVTVDWGLARTVDRLPQPELPGVDGGEDADGKGRGKGGKGRGSGGRGLWDPYQDDRRDGRREAGSPEDGPKGKGRPELLRGVKGAGKDWAGPHAAEAEDRGAAANGALQSSSDSEDADVVPPRGGRRRKNIAPRGLVPLLPSTTMALVAYGAVGRGCGLRARAVALPCGISHVFLEPAGRREVL